MLFTFNKPTPWQVWLYTIVVLAASFLLFSQVWLFSLKYSTRDVQLILADQVSDIETKHPGATLIIMGPINSCDFKCEHLKCQQIRCLGQKNISDHFCCTIKWQCYFLPYVLIGNMGHLTNHMLPTYRQQQNRSKPASFTIKQQTLEAVEIQTDSESLLSACSSVDF